MRTIGIVAAVALAIGVGATSPAHAATTFNVKTFGATGNGTTLDDDAIDKAVSAASALPGGVVVFPKGTYLSRTIHLKSNITLQLNSGATVRAASSGFD